MKLSPKYIGIALMAAAAAGLILPKLLAVQTNASLLTSWLAMLCGLVLYVVLNKRER